MIEFQRLLLGDTVRNSAFFRALKAAIVPGKTIVADIGSGTGYLSFLAEKLGAKECHLYEVSDLLPLSRTLAAENGVKRCKFFQTHSTEVKNPPKVDLVISETLGNYALEENIVETMNDARRFLKPDGLMIPQSLTQCAAPVTSSRLYDELNVWDRVGHGLTFDTAKTMCMNNMYVKDISAEDLHPLSRTERSEVWGRGPGGGGCWDTIDFRKKNASIRRATMEWKAKTDIILYGFALWWEATLFKNITLTTSPFAPSTHWKQIYLPVVDPLLMKKGQTIRLNIRSDCRYTVKINLEWETIILDAKGGEIKKTQQDMRKGYLA